MDNGTCEINVATRNACRYCRFQRCIKVGMSVEGRFHYLYLFAFLRPIKLHQLFHRRLTF